MTEQQMEALEKLFPDGVCLTYMRGNTVRFGTWNPQGLVVLERVRDASKLAVEAQKEFESEDHEPDSWGKEPPT